MPIEHLERDCFPKLLLRHAEERGERPAIREKRRGIWRTMSWRNLADEARALAAALSARGLQRGAHVAFLGDNRPHLFTAISATHWLGAVAVPLYPDATAGEMAPLLKLADVTHAFAENQEQVDKLLSILPLCPSLRCIVYDKDRGLRHYRQPELVSYADLLREGHDFVTGKRGIVAEEIAHVSGDDTAFVFFTSGTTGPAKGVVITHAALIDRAQALMAMEAMSDSDVTLACLPPGWIGQSQFSYAQPMVTGYCVCCPESSETLLADMREIGPTRFLATPRALESMLAQVATRLEGAGRFNWALYRKSIALGRGAGARAAAGKSPSLGDRLASLACDIFMCGPLRDVLGMSRLRAAYIAGDPVAPDLLLSFRALGVNLKQLYGSTETGFVVAVQRDVDVRPDTVGPVADGVELSFTPQGEILVRSAGLFREYHRDPERTARARNQEGWFRTGDIGHLDDDGHLRVIDRLSHVSTLSDGTAYTPKMLENRIKQASHVKEAVTFGDGRNVVCALIDIDAAAVGAWADKHEITYTSHADLAAREAVAGLLAAHVAKVNEELSRLPELARFQIHRFALLPTELSADDGLLTHIGKLRREVIAERYGALIQAMYEGYSQVPLESEADQAPGAAEPVSVAVMIHDAKVAGAAGDRRAA